MNQVGSTETSTSNTTNIQTTPDDTPTDRAENVKATNKNSTNHQLVSINEQQLLPKDNSFTCLSLSDCQLTTPDKTATTTTTLIPPPQPIPPNANVRHVQTFSLDMNNSQSNGSILVRAYSEQEKEKPTTSL